MKGKYVDFHTHTKVSDGVYTPFELMEMAKKAGIGVMAFTEHNCLPPDFEAYEKAAGEDLKLILGTEASTTYVLKCTGRCVKPHIVLLLPDRSVDLSPLAELLERNGEVLQRQYVAQMNEALLPFGWQGVTYDELAAHFNTQYIGRPHLAEYMAVVGFTSSMEEALDLYIGEFGQKKAYISKPNGVLLEELLEVAHKVQAIPILAHMHYYQFSKEEKEEFIPLFKELGGPLAAMETAYAAYTEEQCKELDDTANEYHLGKSAGSDFHGLYASDTLENQFSMDFAKELFKSYEEYYGVRIINTASEMA